MNIDRRALLGIFAIAAGVHPARADERELIGCAISPSKAQLLDLIAGSAQHELSPSQVNRFLRPTSGFPNFDSALGRVLVDMSRFFDELPGFSFFRDGVASMNAVASVQDWAGTNRAGSILFGIEMLKHQLDREVGGDIAVLAICAHEFAHIKQFNSGEYTRMQNLMPSYCTELQADYLAGFYLYKYFQTHSNINLQGVGIAWEDLGVGPFANPGSHGRAVWRIASLEAGFFLNRDNPGLALELAIRRSREFVRRYA